MAEPGWEPPDITPDKGDCMRLAFSCVTGIHPIKIHFIDADKHKYVPFWLKWREHAEEHGYRLMKLPQDWAEADKYWIAVVRGIRSRNSHAIVMSYDRLHYDSAHQRVQRPHKFLECYVVYPL